MATTTTFNGKKVHQGMIKSQKTRVGDFIIAFIIFLTMMICLLPMVNVLGKLPVLQRTPDSQRRVPLAQGLEF